MGTVTTEVRKNRIKFISYLRLNPMGFGQFTGSLSDGDMKRCAIGMACEVFNVPFNRYAFYADEEKGQSPYDAVSELLDVEVDYIWRLNDGEELTFDEIAENLEDYWELV
jgi:hypothetical protein